MVRKEEEAEYFKSIGVSAVLFKGLEQVDLLKKTASEHDVVVNTASAFQPQAAEALIQGLAERKKTSSAPVYFINVSPALKPHYWLDCPLHVSQTSGTSSIANRPVSKIYLDANEQIEFSDKDDIASYELQREALEQYGQRTTDLAVVATGVATGVPTYILMSPTIYGQGTGHFNKRSIQIPLLTRLAIAKGYAEYIGDGAGVWDHAHIDDTAALYELVLTKLLSGETLPSGKSGIYFAGAGRSSWKGVAEGIAKAGYKLGALKEQVARSVGLEAMAQDAGNFPVQFVELGFASR